MYPLYHGVFVTACTTDGRKGERASDLQTSRQEGIEHTLKESTIIMACDHAKNKGQEHDAMMKTCPNGANDYCIADLHLSIFLQTWKTSNTIEHKLASLLNIRWDEFMNNREVFATTNAKPIK